MLHWLLLWWLCGVVAGIVARFKGRSSFGYFLLGMVAGPLALIVAAMPPFYGVREVTEEDVLKEQLSFDPTPPPLFRGGASEEGPNRP